MNPTVEHHQLPTITRGGHVFDTVKVSPDTFESVMFVQCEPRTEWTPNGGNNGGMPKPQKHTKDGLPIWSVKVAATNWRKQSDMLSVTVAQYDNPADQHAPGSQVQFVGLTFGVSAKRDGNGFVTWCSADGLQPAGQPARGKATADA
ncbi:MAG: hypothetical protein ACRDRT_11090 [Pseudonocardiaceae bacterium]